MGIETEEILSFWFGEARNDETKIEKRSERWFGVDREFDAEIRLRFGTAVAATSKGQLHNLADTASGLLALVLLLDQFPRNIFRGHDKAYAFDSLSLQRRHEGMACGFDTQLRTVERVFFYLPLERAEDPESQASSVACFENLLSTAPHSFKDLVQTNLNFAREHFVLIERFGRFPPPQSNSWAHLMRGRTRLSCYPRNQLRTGLIECVC
jgi:uncharacterized protein (DUF924 family)